MRMLARKASRGDGPVARTSSRGRMESVRSRDRTVIRYLRRGSGPPLLLIHGTNANYNQWLPIMPALSRHHTVYAMARRGHQGSEDAASYELDREIEDVI